MRRLLIIFSLVGLVCGSLGLAVLAADWPFWQRAWHWHAADTGWPEQVPGVWRSLGQGQGAPMLAVAGAPESAALAQLAQRGAVRALLASRAGALIAEHYGAEVRSDSLLQGRGLTTLVLAPLYGIARQQSGIDLLDRPLAALLPEWRDDSRGAITPRQLLWQTSGLAAPPFQPFNPFSDRARLAAGPNFERAALGFAAVYPPGSHFEPSPANAQLLALVLSRAQGQRFAQRLETDLWQPLGAGRAQLMLDRPGGEMAAHCCLAATARDWLRLAQWLASEGVVGGRRVLPAGFIAEMAVASPVHPGQGLGVRVGQALSGERLLWGESEGRLLLAVPERQLAAVWFAPAALPPEAAADLLAALGLQPAQINP